MMRNDQTVVITGAGSGLGRGLCRELARVGHKILATDKNLDTAQETISMLDNPARGEAHALDVTSAQDVQCFAKMISDRPVSVLINNAGLQHVAPLESFPQEKWDLLLNVLLRGSCLMTRALLPGMRARGFGRIVNIGSIHSLVASPYKSAYVAAKHGLVGFSKVVALETADTDITINTICPSYVRTPLVEAQIAGQAKSHGMSEDEVIEKIMLDPMPKKAFITSEEIAGTIRFLASPEARNITGQTIVIDGGWTVQ